MIYSSYVVIGGNKYFRPGLVGSGNKSLSLAVSGWIGPQMATVSITFGARLYAERKERVTQELISLKTKFIVPFACERPAKEGSYAWSWKVMFNSKVALSI